MGTIKTKIDILLVSETKLDSSFTLYEFLKNVFASPWSLNWNQNGRGKGIMLCIREDILPVSKINAIGKYLKIISSRSIHDLKSG